MTFASLPSLEHHGIHLIRLQSSYRPSPTYILLRHANALVHHGYPHIQNLVVIANKSGEVTHHWRTSVDSCNQSMKHSSVLSCSRRFSHVNVIADTILSGIPNERRPISNSVDADDSRIYHISYHYAFNISQEITQV